MYNRQQTTLPESTNPNVTSLKRTCEDSKLNSSDNTKSLKINNFQEQKNKTSQLLWDEKINFSSDPLMLSNERDFKNMYKITHSSFHALLSILSKEEMEPIENIQLYKKLLIVLWVLGNAGSYSKASQKFGVTEEAVANCFFDVCATLYNKSDSIIMWPDQKESNEIAARIEKKYSFPGVVGVLGCNYFSIRIPKEVLTRREHFNAKQRCYCIALQIVCDDLLVIRDIFPGLAGGLPEARILRDSPLSEQLAQLVEPNKHVLARAEFPQLASMLTPYNKAAGDLSEEEDEFNQLHENVNLLVDQTFQMLLDRFQILKMLDPEVATMVLVTVSIIHNICLENGDIFQS